MTHDEMKKLTLSEFDKEAERFDNNNPSVYNMCHKEYGDILEEIGREPFSSLLDAGCGTGAMISVFKENIPDAQYTGIDLSEKMIKVAKKKNLQGVSFIHGDCEKLPFDDESFDVITCSMSFHHYPDPVSFFKNVERVLKKNGRFVLRDMTFKHEWVCSLVNMIEMPVIRNILRKGDVHVYSKNDIQMLCKMSSLKLEKFEVRKGFRLHSVMRKI